MKKLQVIVTVMVVILLFSALTYAAEIRISVAKSNE